VDNTQEEGVFTMSKLVTLSVVVVLLTATGTFAQALGAIDHIQDSFVGLNNQIDLQHGHQNAASQQNLCVDNSQAASQICGSYGNERFLGNFVQTGNAWGDCAVVGLVQQVSAVGSQAQFVGQCVGPKAQGQNLILGAVQGLAKTAGPGGGDANHVIVLQESQEAANSAGTMQESTNIVGLQDSSINGTAAATGAVSSTMDVQTTQNQATL
jgi:hypothetical protein